RDKLVTGVQTCALPIYFIAAVLDEPVIVSGVIYSDQIREGRLQVRPAAMDCPEVASDSRSSPRMQRFIQPVNELVRLSERAWGRSEERRVGKEWRARGG